MAANTPSSGMGASATCGEDHVAGGEAKGGSGRSVKISPGSFPRWCMCSMDLSPAFLSFAKRPHGWSRGAQQKLHSSGEPEPVSPRALGRGSKEGAAPAPHSPRVSRRPSCTVTLTFPALPRPWVLPSSERPPHSTADQAGWEDLLGVTEPTVNSYKRGLHLILIFHVYLIALAFNRCPLN